MAITAPLVSRFNALRDYTGSLAYGPLVQVSRAIVTSLLDRIEIGRLEVVHEDGESSLYGKPQRLSEEAPHATLKVHRDMFWVRLLLFADMGFAESYMLGEVSCPDLTDFFKLFILNREQLANGSTITGSLSSSLSGLLRKANNLTNARLNIAAHYDISNAMFASFLSPDMTYSCPIWLPKTDPRSNTETLEEAQMRKLDYFIDGACLKSTDRVLEIGTGWGSLAIRAVRRTGCRVTSLTLSIEQKELAEERIREAGLSDRIEVLLCDYRALPVPKEGPFDKVISIEMLEAVGREYMVTYFNCIDKLLKKDGGIALFQCITMPETRYDAYASSDDFIRRYIFPGGHLPTVSQLISSITAGSSNRLIVDSVLNIGPHYSKTLRLWREKFLDNFETEIKPSLLVEHEGMSKVDVEIFKRKWEYYFTYCEAGFWTSTLGDVIIRVAREGSRLMAEDVPF